MNTTTLATTETLTDDNSVYCQDCGVAMSDGEIDECGYQCSKCYTKTHFLCYDCHEMFDNEDRSSKSKSICQGCQDTRDEAELEAKMDALKDEARELLESICNDADLSLLKKTVAAMKRLQPE
jgi:hypothetical protein